MNLDPGRLTIINLIGHELSGTFEGRVQLTDEVSPLVQEDRNYFRARIVESLDSASISAVFDDTAVRTVRDLVEPYLSMKGWDLVAASKEIATMLGRLEYWNSPDGLLIVAEATTPTANCVIIMKLDKDDGMQFKAEGKSGNRMMRFQRAEGLTLTTSKRVFKLAVFHQERGEDLEILITDNQNDGGVADFFLKRFLGCKREAYADEQTLRAFKAFEKFNNGPEVSSESKFKYEQAWTATMSNEQVEFDPADFAQEYLKVEDRDQFMASLEANNAPVTSFNKSLGLVEKKLATQRYEFDNGLFIVGTKEAYDQVDVKEAEDGSVTVTFKAGIQRVKGGSR